MRGSILVTFDELVKDRGIDNWSLEVSPGSNTLRDVQFTDCNNLYSTYVFTGNTVNFTLIHSLDTSANITVKRFDYTTDDEGGDNGIKEVNITPVIQTFVFSEVVTIVTFTASTVPSAYNFHYVIECSTSFCYDNSLGFTGGDGPEVTDIDILSNGKIMISGEYLFYSGTAANRIIQLNQDGTINTGFTYGTGFQADTTNELVELSDGKLVVVGQFTNYNGTEARYIIGLNPNGTVDTGFVTGTGFNPLPLQSASPETIERQSDDKVIIGGAFWNYNGTTSPKIIRLNTNGTVDNTFVVGSGFTSGGTFTNTDAVVTCLAIQSDGKIIVGGNFDAYSGTSVTRICRLNSNGTLDNTFTTGTGLNNVPRTIKIQPDGKILIGGTFTSYGGFVRNRIVRLNSDGTIDSTVFVGLGGGFNGDVNAIEFAQDGTILVGGNFTSYSGSSSYQRLINLNSNGSVNTSFQTNNPNERVDSIAVLPDGDIYVGGLFSLFGSTTVQRFVKLSSNGSLISCLPPTPTPTPSMSPTPTGTGPTPTPAGTLTPTPTGTLTPTPTPTATIGPTPTPSPTPVPQILKLWWSYANDSIPSGGFQNTIYEYYVTWDYSGTTGQSATYTTTRTLTNTPQTVNVGTETLPSYLSNDNVSFSVWRRLCGTRTNGQRLKSIKLYFTSTNDPSKPPTWGYSNGTGTNGCIKTCPTIFNEITELNTIFRSTYVPTAYLHIMVEDKILNQSC